MAGCLSLLEEHRQHRERREDCLLNYCMAEVSWRSAWQL